MARGKKTGGKDFARGGHQPKKRGKPSSLPPDLKMANDLTKTNLRGLLNKYLWMTNAELQQTIDEKTVPMIEIVIASIIAKAALSGDERRLDFILDRMVGKVKEEIDINTYHERLAKLPDSEVIQMGVKALTFLKGGND